jgi:hypothetical protein
MGDFFNEVVIFLEDNYVYVIGVGLIIILMLIGLLASRRKARKNAKEEEPMANINEVNTGSINDVANTLQSDVMQPVDVVTFPENNEPIVKEVTPQPIAPEVPSTPVYNSVNIEPITPIVNEPSFVNPTTVEPIANTFTNSTASTVQPIVEAYSPVEEVKPVVDDDFDKTEVIDFSPLQPVTPSDTREDNVVPFIVDKSQYNDTDSMLNGEDSSNETPRV